jgi:hypothetical protein
MSSCRYGAIATDPTTTASPNTTQTGRAVGAVRVADRMATIVGRRPLRVVRRAEAFDVRGSA